MDKNYLPDALYLGGKGGTLELLEGKGKEGKTIIYVCRNKACKYPVEDVDEAVGMVGERP